MAPARAQPAQGWARASWACIGLYRGYMPVYTAIYGYIRLYTGSARASQAWGWAGLAGAWA